MSQFKNPELPKHQSVGDEQIDTGNFNRIADLAGHHVTFSDDFDVQNDGLNTHVALNTTDPESCPWFRCTLLSPKDRQILIEEGWLITGTQHMQQVLEQGFTVPGTTGLHAVYLEHTPAGGFVYTSETWPLPDPDPWDQGHKMRRVICHVKVADVGGTAMAVDVTQTHCGGFLRFDAENHFASFWAVLESAPSGGGGQDWKKVRRDGLANYTEDLDFPWNQDNAGGQCEHVLGAGEAYPTGTVVLMQRLRTSSGMRNVYTIPDLPGFWAEVDYSTGSGDWQFAEREPNDNQDDFVALTPAGRSGTAMEVNGATAADGTTLIAWIQPTLDAGGDIAYCFEYDEDEDTIYTPPAERVFTGLVSKSGSGWTFVEQEQTASGFVGKSGGVSGDCRERNGLLPVASGGQSFYVDVIEYDNGTNKYYSFNLPLYELGTALEVLRTDSAVNNWEWGCAEIS